MIDENNAISPAGFSIEFSSKASVRNMLFLLYRIGKRFEYLPPKSFRVYDISRFSLLEEALKYRVTVTITTNANEEL